MEIMEKKVEKYLVKKAKELSCLCYKFVSPQNAGVCDRIVVKDGRTYYVELKCQSGKLSELQLKFISDMANQGIEVYVLASAEEIDEFYKEVII